MASNDPTEARARFLQEAAYILAVSSPTTAAFLGRARNKLVEDAELEIPSKEADTYRRSICNACGNIMIPGWSCKISNHLPGEGPTKKDSNKSKNPPKLEKSIRYTCLMCHRETNQALRQKARRKNKKSTPAPDTEPVSASKKPAREVDNAPKTLNASSKQRQKARKGGLQAMLDKKKSQDSGNGGLDLMDFAM
jgi:RNase P subunit RPR2